MHTRHWMLRETAHCSEGCRTKGMAKLAIPVFYFYENRGNFSKGLIFNTICGILAYS